VRKISGKEDVDGVLHYWVEWTSSLNTRWYMQNSWWMSSRPNFEQNEVSKMGKGDTF
jgi:hypothetical protein